MQATGLGPPVPTYGNTATKLQQRPRPRNSYSRACRGPSRPPNEQRWQPTQEAAHAPPHHTRTAGAARDPALTSFRRGMTGITKYEFL